MVGHSGNVDAVLLFSTALDRVVEVDKDAAVEIVVFGERDDVVGKDTDDEEDDASVALVGLQTASIASLQVPNAD